MLSWLEHEKWFYNLGASNTVPATYSCFYPCSGSLLFQRSNISFLEKTPFQREKTGIQEGKKQGTEIVSVVKMAPQST